MNRRDCLTAIMAGTTAPAMLAGALADGVATPADIQAEITALLRRTEEFWDAQDTAGMRTLWDADDAEPFYLAAEQDNWFVGWEALNGYLAPAGEKVTEAIRVHFYDIRARLLAPDLAYAAYWMRTDMKIIYAPKPFGSDNRVSAVFRRKSAGWRYLCYAEGFQSPGLYMQKLFEKNVSPDYAEYARKQRGK